jgi:hypothetical protein
MNDGSEWLADPPPEPEVQSLTNADHVNIVATSILVEDILKAMLDDVGDSDNIASVYPPFQVLLRQLMIAGQQYFSMQGQSALAESVKDLLDSGKLDSPSVARSPSPAEVQLRMLSELEKLSSDVYDLYKGPEGDVVKSVIADAMDCAYKQAIGAPQTVGSMFARLEPS